MTLITILIVDDDETQHEILGAYLERAGYRVTHAYDGHAGLSAARAQPPDLILLDLIMPALDGFQVLGALQAEPTLRVVPVLLLTSHDQRHLKIKGLELERGAIHVLPDPTEEHA